MCQHYTFAQNLFTTHTYLTYAFSLINTDGRNAAVDPHWGRVIHQTLPSLLSLAPPIQEGSGNQTSLDLLDCLRRYNVQILHEQDEVTGIGTTVGV